jgi:head-tail adaptor
MAATDAWNIDAGDLQQQIVIQTGTVGAADSRGKTAITWPSIASNPATGTLVRCKIEGLPAGRKGEICRQMVPSATHLVTMRYRAGLNEELNRLVFKLGRILNIGWIDDVENMHVKLELTCTELKDKTTVT